MAKTTVRKTGDKYSVDQKDNFPYKLDDDKERLPKWPQMLVEVVSLDW